MSRVVLFLIAEIQKMAFGFERENSEGFVWAAPRAARVNRAAIDSLK